MLLILTVILSFTLSNTEKCTCTVSVVSNSNTFPLGFIFDDPEAGCGPSESADPVDNWNGKSVYYRATETGGGNTVYDFQIDCLHPCWIQNINMGGCGWKQSRLRLYNGDKSTELGNKLVSSTLYNWFLFNVNLDLTGNEVYLTQFRFVETNIDTGGRYRTPFTITSQQHPTARPTPAPTARPTPAPTTIPTQAPTATPTQAPTDTNCEDVSQIKRINWNKLINNMDNNSAEIPYSNFNIALDENTLEMTFNIDLEYVGDSSDGDFDTAYNLGTTYIVGFDSFGTTGNKINQPGNCQNRIVSSFQSGTFDEWWNYSEYTYLTSNDLGSNTYLSYPPPSQYWTLSIAALSCTPINYLGVFSWNDLSLCTNYNGNNLISILDDGTSITLPGTFYVNLVSPYSMSAIDSGIYRTFPLIQQDFSISILKQINVLSSTETELFIASIIGIYEDETDESFELSILIQSADYIVLTNPNIISTPNNMLATITSVTSSCLVSSAYTCGQIFTVTIDQSQINCTPADFTGVYQISFTATCPGNDPVCNAFFDDNGSLVALEVTSNFIDNTCKPQIYQVIFDGNMRFYDDDQFAILHNDQNGDNDYIIGQSMIYVEIEVNFPDDGSGDNYDIFNVEIDNVFVCTADDNIDLTLNLTQQNGAGGCLSSNIDVDGPYNIITNGVANTAEYETQIVSNAAASNIVQFAFLTFDVGRTQMYVHTQLMLILQNGNRRRLQLLQTSNTNSDQIRHFIASTTISKQIISETILMSTTSSQKEDETDSALIFTSSISFICAIYIYCVMLY